MYLNYGTQKDFQEAVSKEVNLDSRIALIRLGGTTVQEKVRTNRSGYASENIYRFVQYINKFVRTLIILYVVTGCTIQYKTLHHHLTCLEIVHCY